MRKIVFFVSLALTACTTREIQIDVDEQIADVQPTMWGLFFEDINFAADGGIYAEMVKNRSFEFTKPLMGWKLSKSAGNGSFFAILNDSQNSPNNPRYAQIKTTGGDSFVELENEGFRGMGIKRGTAYTFTVMLKNVGQKPMNIDVELDNGSGKTICKGKISVAADSVWRKYAVDLKPEQTCSDGKLTIRFSGDGELYADMLSMFPDDTWKNRKEGLRADLVQLLADLEPGFLRFPGGCIVEGSDLSLRYQWKKTLGPISNRPTMINRWNTEFGHRLTPDYFQTFGLGFYEYFQLAEDIGAEPLPILSCGMACQYNSGELVPLNQLDEYVQDAIDLVEFANGDVTTEWGRIRAEMGHPAPFGLKMIGVGNEQWGPQYFERYALFEKALREKCPDIKIVSGSGPSAEGFDFDYAWNEFRSKKYSPDIVDEHYYKNPDWFLQNADRYDSNDRNGPKVFAGEYAAQSKAIGSPENRNVWKCALAEAAFMTGLERNAGVVTMASYAPLFGHLQGWQWTPDLIWFDNLKSYGTPNYYVQKMFSTNRGHKVVKAMVDGKKPIGKGGLYVSSVIDTVANALIVKVVNTNKREVAVRLNLKGVHAIVSEADMTVVRADGENAENSVDAPLAVSPVSQKIEFMSPDLMVDFPASSLSVLKIKM